MGLLNAFVHYKPECTIEWINNLGFSKQTKGDGVDNLYMPLRIFGNQQVHMLFQRNREGCYIVFYNKQLEITHTYFLSNNKQIGIDLPTIDPLTTMDMMKKIVPLANAVAKKINDTISRKKNAQKPKRAHSPFLIYSLENRERIKKENPTASYGDIARLVHASFTKQSNNDLIDLEMKVNKEKKKYTKEIMKEYKSPARYKDDEDEKGGKKRKKKRGPNAPKQATSALLVPTKNDLIITFCRGQTVVNDRLDTIFDEVRQLYNNNKSKQLEQTIKPRVLYPLRESIKKS